MAGYAIGVLDRLALISLEARALRFQIGMSKPIRLLVTPPEPRKRKIGFLVRERAVRYGRG